MLRSVVTLIIILVLVIVAVFFVDPKISNPTDLDEVGNEAQQIDDRQDINDQESEDITKVEIDIDSQADLPAELVEESKNLQEAENDYQQAKEEEKELISDPNTTLEDIEKVVDKVDKTKDKLEETQKEVAKKIPAPNNDNYFSEVIEDTNTTKLNKSLKEESSGLERNVESEKSLKNPSEESTESISSSQLSNTNVLDEYSFAGPKPKNN